MSDHSADMNKWSMYFKEFQTLCEKENALIEKVNKLRYRKWLLLDRMNFISRKLGPDFVLSRIKP